MDEIDHNREIPQHVAERVVVLVSVVHLDRRLRRPIQKQRLFVAWEEESYLERQSGAKKRAQEGLFQKGHENQEVPLRHG